MSFVSSQNWENYPPTAPEVHYIPVPKYDENFWRGHLWEKTKVSYSFCGTRGPCHLFHCTFLEKPWTLPWEIRNSKRLNVSWQNTCLDWLLSQDFSQRETVPVSSADLRSMTHAQNICTWENVQILARLQPHSYS